MKETYDLAFKWFEALRSGNREELFGYMDDNIRWENCKVVKGLTDVIPWLGSYQGKYEVQQTFEIHDKLATMDNFDLNEIYVDGNVILAHGYETNRLIETGEIYHADVIFQMKHQGNKIVEWKVFWDTAEAVAAFKKKPMTEETNCPNC